MGLFFSEFWVYISQFWLFSRNSQFTSHNYYFFLEFQSLNIAIITFFGIQSLHLVFLTFFRIQSLLFAILTFVSEFRVYNQMMKFGVYITQFRFFFSEFRVYITHLLLFFGIPSIKSHKNFAIIVGFFILSLHLAFWFILDLEFTFSNSDYYLKIQSLHFSVYISFWVYISYFWLFFGIQNLHFAILTFVSEFIDCISQL